MDIIISATSVVLLAFGFVMRLSSRPGSGSGPWWRARSAFASHRAYIRYVVGTNCIVVGAMLGAILFLQRVLAH